MSDTMATLRRTVENNLIDAKNALLLLPPGRSDLRDYIDSIRFNCEHALASLDNGSSSNAMRGDAK